MTSVLEAELELNRQYDEYKTQFESWKTTNQNAIGTDAYNDYVRQFREWEKDVEKRRANIRERAEREEREARLLQQEEEEKARKTQAQKEAEDAQAYLQSQQSYLAHHQAAIEAERAKAQMQSVQYHVATQNYGIVNADGTYGPTSIVAATISSAPVTNSLAATNTNQPQLWGSNKIAYDIKDPMFLRWGARAAPPHIESIPPSNKTPNPYWLVQEAMAKKKKIIAPVAQAPVAPQMPQVPQMIAPPMPIAPRHLPSLFSLPLMPRMNGTRM